MSLSYVCCVCREHIFDHMLYECDGRHFHAQCLKCQMCAHSIQPECNDKLYAINGLLVCFKDYSALRAICKVCGQRIADNEYNFKTRDRELIHMKCMSCQSCRQSLERGDKYVITADNRLLCHKCCHQYANPNQFGAGTAMAQMQTTAPTPQPNGSRRGRKRANNP